MVCEQVLYGHQAERGERFITWNWARGTYHLSGVWIRWVVSHSFRSEKSSVVCYVFISSFEVVLLERDRVHVFMCVEAYICLRSRTLYGF